MVLFLVIGLLILPAVALCCVVALRPNVRTDRTWACCVLAQTFLILQLVMVFAGFANNGFGDLTFLVPLALYIVFCAAFFSLTCCARQCCGCLDLQTPESASVPSSSGNIAAQTRASDSNTQAETPGKLTCARCLLYMFLICTFLVSMAGVATPKQGWGSDTPTFRSRQRESIGWFCCDHLTGGNGKEEVSKAAGVVAMLGCLVSSGLSLWALRILYQHGDRSGAMAKYRFRATNWSLAVSLLIGTMTYYAVVIPSLASPGSMGPVWIVLVICAILAIVVAEKGSSSLGSSTVVSLVSNAPCGAAPHTATLTTAQQARAQDLEDPDTQALTHGTVILKAYGLSFCRLHMTISMDVYIPVNVHPPRCNWLIKS